MSYPYYGVPQVPLQNMLYLFGRKVSESSEIQPNEIPMTGDICYFPVSDGSRIISKQWKTDGTIDTKEYVLRDNFKKDLTLDQLDRRIYNLEKRVFNKNKKYDKNKSYNENWKSSYNDTRKQERFGSVNDNDRTSIKNGEKQSEVQDESNSSTLS